MDSNIDGSVGDGCQQDIKIRLETVVETIQNIYEGLNKFKKRHRDYLNYINKNVMTEELF